MARSLLKIKNFGVLPLTLKIILGVPPTLPRQKWVGMCCLEELGRGGGDKINKVYTPPPKKKIVCLINYALQKVYNVNLKQIV